MPGGVITISKRKYAAGLFWQPVSTRDNPRESAKKISHIVGSSLYVSFNGMVGLGSFRIGARLGMPVAAAEVMESFNETSFLSAFNVREGVWILGVRGGVIIKDKVFDNLYDAKNEYATLNEMPDWGLLVAPGDWNAPSAVERNLIDIMSGSNKHRLSHISHIPGYIMTVGIFAAFIYLGYSFFSEPIKKLTEPKPEQLKIDPKIAAEYKERLAKINEPKPKEKVPVHIEFPYEALPLLNDKIDQCYKAIAFLSQPITGWVIDSVLCVDGEATAKLIRNFGNISDLYDDVGQKMPGVLIDDTDGNNIIISAKLNPLDKQNQKPSQSIDTVMTTVQSKFQQIDIDGDFSRDLVDLEIPELKENEFPDTDLTDTKVVRISATSKLKPSEFIRVLDGIESIDVKSIKWDNRNRNWTYDITIYVSNL